MKCSACGNEYDGNFCPMCGKSSSESLILPENPKINKNPFYKKWQFLVVIVVITFIIGFVSGGFLYKSINSQYKQDSLQQKKNSRDTFADSTSDFDKYYLSVGEYADIPLKLSAKNIAKDDFLVISSDTDVVEISDISAENSENYTEIKFRCNALSAGSSIVEVVSKDGKLMSNSVYFTVEPAPKIKSMGNFITGSTVGKVGDKIKVSVHMTPVGITKDDFKILNTDSSVAEISGIQVTDDGGDTVLTFMLLLNKSGKTEISVISADEKTESETVTYVVKDDDAHGKEDITRKNENFDSSTEDTNAKSTKDANGTVYVTPNGKKYHLSPSCGGKNAKATSLDEAKADGKTACGKCASS